MPERKAQRGPKRSPRVITAEDLYRFQLITDSRISPDGKHVIYSVERVDRKTEKKFTNLWLAPAGAGRPRQFTYGDHVDSHPRWSPDGKSIAFLSDRKDGKRSTDIYHPGGRRRGEAGYASEGKFRRLRVVARRPDHRLRLQEKGQGRPREGGRRRQEETGRSRPAHRPALLQAGWRRFPSQRAMAYLDGQHPHGEGQPAYRRRPAR